MPQTLLLTRPRVASERFLKLLEAVGVKLPTVISPVIEISGAVPDGPKGTAHIFTSEHGVRFSGATGGRAWVVGRQTATAARSAGIDVALVAPDAEALVAYVIADPPDSPLVHYRGEHSRGDIVPRLAAAGVSVDEVVVYRQIEQPLSDEALHVFAGDDPVILPLFSPRSAALVANQITRPTAVCQTVALSEAVAAAWPFAPAPIVAAEKTGTAMAKEVQKLANG